MRAANKNGLLAAFALLVLFSCAPLADDAVPFGQTSPSAPGQRYPVTTSSLALGEAYTHVSQWDGHWISVQGIIKSVDFNQRGQPSIELSLDSNGDTTLWALWALIDTSGMDSFLQAGKTLRVAGWLKDSNWATETLHAELPRQNPMTLLAVCLVNSSGAVADSHYVEACNAWRDGHSVSNMR